MHQIYQTLFKINKIIKIKKNFCIFFFIFSLIAAVQGQENYKIIATINNQSITEFDLLNEIKVIKIINNSQINTNKISDIALKNLIEEKIKLEEIKNNKFNFDQKTINEYYQIFLNNSKIDVKKINKEFENLIKEKIEIDTKWNQLILKKYAWKLNINLMEIEKNFNNNLNAVKKEELIEIEKNKKLKVFSNYHLNIIKKNTLIKIF